MGGDGESVRRQWGENDSNCGWRQLPSGQASEAGGVANSSGERRQQDASRTSGDESANGWESANDHKLASDLENRWLANADWLHCSDGLYRPVESGTFPLAHGVPKRMGKLRAYGNAIVPQIAAEFIVAFDES